MSYEIFKSQNKNKKYVAVFDDGKKIHFGDNRYQHYEDKTKLKSYKHLDHKDKKRRDSYYARHGKAELHSAKWFSHKYLW